jgi:hypothetical protein
MSCSGSAHGGLYKTGLAHRNDDHLHRARAHELEQTSIDSVPEEDAIARPLAHCDSGRVDVDRSCAHPSSLWFLQEADATAANDRRTGRGGVSNGLRHRPCRPLAAPRGDRPDERQLE